MFVTRCNQDIIYKSFESPFVSAVLGPRRVGKSTLVEHYTQEHPQNKWVHLNMDILSERQRVEASELEVLIEERARQKIQGDEPLWVTIDEAQKCPALFEQIKVIYDRWKGTKALKWILTGSGFLTLHRLASESLAGRIEIFYLREFSLRESCALQEKRRPAIPSIFDRIFSTQANSWQDCLSNLTPFRKGLCAALKEQMIWGGLPEVLQLTEPEEKIRYLGNYLQTYLEKDVRDIATITDLGLYQKIMEIFAQQTGSIRDDGRLLQALGCSRDTLKKYRGYLEATLIYQEVYPYIGSSLKRLVKSPKGYLTNNGLISYLTGIYDLNILEKTATIGHRYENWALREILISLDRDPRQSQVYFWRTSGNKEVDFVVEKPPHVFPFEITYGSQPDRKKLKNLKSFLREEKKANWGFYIYNGEFQMDPEERILFIPGWILG